jgi:hypothetical protein
MSIQYGHNRHPANTKIYRFHEVKDGIKI